MTIGEKNLGERLQLARHACVGALREKGEKQGGEAQSHLGQNSDCECSSRKISRGVSGLIFIYAFLLRVRAKYEQELGSTGGYLLVDAQLCILCASA